MLARRLRPAIEGHLRHMPAVVLLGPRQVGKTTLARQIASERGARAIYLDLERPADRRRLDDADAYLRVQAGKLVILDEIHRAPALFESLRGLIDERRLAGERAGHFLLLGSASIDLMKQASETLAGRIAATELAPIDILELPQSIAVSRLWSRGGFPESVLASDDALSLAWRRAFVRSCLWSAMSRCSPRAFRPKRWDGSGRCSRMHRAPQSTSLGSRRASRSQRLQ